MRLLVRSYFSLTDSLSDGRALLKKRYFALQTPLYPTDSRHILYTHTWKFLPHKPADNLRLHYARVELDKT